MFRSSTVIPTTAFLKKNGRSHYKPISASSSIRQLLKRQKVQLLYGKLDFFSGAEDKVVVEGLFDAEHEVEAGVRYGEWPGLHWMPPSGANLLCYHRLSVPSFRNCHEINYIGTTTIAMSSIAMPSTSMSPIAVSSKGAGGRVLRTVTGINHQRAYGTDVISRIDASNSEKDAALQESILADLAKCGICAGTTGAGSTAGPEPALPPTGSLQRSGRRQVSTTGASSCRQRRRWRTSSMERQSKRPRCCRKTALSNTAPVCAKQERTFSPWAAAATNNV